MNQLRLTTNLLIFLKQKNPQFNAKVFVQWLANGVFHSFVCFIIPMYTLSGAVYPNSGQGVEVYTIGVAVYSCVLVVVTIKCAIETSAFTILNHIVLWCSVIAWFIFVFGYGSLLYIPPMRAINDWLIANLSVFGVNFIDFFGQWRIFITFTFWAVLLLTCSVALLRDVFWKFWVRTSSRHLYYEVQAKSGKMSKEELLAGFPAEELEPPSKKYSIVAKPDLPDVRKLISAVGTKAFRGYAFSQDEAHEATKAQGSIQ